METYDLNIPGAKRIKLGLGTPRHVSRIVQDFVGRHDLDDDTVVRLAYVIDPTYSNRIIRRYAYIVPRLELRICRPCYSGYWPEMDTWVSRVMGNAPVHDYSVSQLGSLQLSARKDH